MDMTFRRATDILGIPAADLAAALGVQTQTVRQMRLAPSAANHRSPPKGWEQTLSRLAQQRGKELAALAEHLKSQMQRR